MAGCCANKEKDLESTVIKHKNILWTVLLINLVMFFVESISGWFSASLALSGDSLDMLGDAVTYASSIAVVGLAFEKKALVAKLKATIMLIFGFVIVAQCFYRALHPTVPDFSYILGVGAIALLANLFCLYLLTSVKDDDVNMSSVWICSRNDIIANCSVLVSGAVVYFTSSGIPDLIVGIGLTYLFTTSAISIFKNINSSKPAKRCGGVA